eukprot:748439-Hanusia_phi.AAC.7
MQTVKKTWSTTLPYIHLYYHPTISFIQVNGRKEGCSQIPADGNSTMRGVEWDRWAGFIYVAPRRCFARAMHSRQVLPLIALAGCFLLASAHPDEVVGTDAHCMKKLDVGIQYGEMGGAVQSSTGRDVGLVKDGKLIPCGTTLKSSTTGLQVWLTDNVATSTNQFLFELKFSVASATGWGFMGSVDGGSCPTVRLSNSKYSTSSTVTLPSADGDLTVRGLWAADSNHGIMVNECKYTISATAADITVGTDWRAVTIPDTPVAGSNALSGCSGFALFVACLLAMVSRSYV